MGKICAQSAHCALLDSKFLAVLGTTDVILVSGFCHCGTVDSDSQTSQVSEYDSKESLVSPKASHIMWKQSFVGNRTIQSFPLITKIGTAETAVVFQFHSLQNICDQGVFVIPFRTKVFLTRKTAWMVVVSMCIFLASINIPLFFTRKMDTYPTTTDTYCKTTGSQLWNNHIQPWIDLTFFSLLPSSIIICMMFAILEAQ